MPSDPGVFEAFYYSALQHPWLLWLAAILGVGACLARAPGLHASLRRYALALGALSLADAWLTSHHVYGIGTLPEGAASYAPFFFVLAGDFRYLLLVLAGTPDGRLEPKPLGIVAALGLTLIVPLSSQLLLSILPEAWAGDRVLFLVYELLFFVLATVLAQWHVRMGQAPWLVALSRYVMLYYGLWAAADILLLATGWDLGFGLRVLPNLLYYGGLIAAIGWLAPAPESEGRPR